MSSLTHASATRSGVAPAQLWTWLGGARLALVWLPLAVILIITVAGAALAPYNPDEVDIRARMSPPTREHLMGTDPLGRDVLSRVMAGARSTVPNVFIILITAVTVGVLVGASAGFLGGRVDSVLMRLTDVFLAFPALVLALAIVGILGPNLLNAIIAIIIVWWPWYARLVRGQVLSIKNEVYIEAARSLGCNDRQVMWRHVLPNSMAPVGVQAMLDIGAALLTTATLGYLGVGAQPPSSEWGAMLAMGRTFFLDAWWLTAFPGLAIFVTVLVFNGAGERLRARLGV
jgi:peptide/nickel transport system permease protein